MKNVTKILCLFVMVLAMACTKEGPQGPAGANGINGTNGMNGNANVQYSDWMTAGTWLGYDSPSAYYTWNTPAITQAVLDSANIVVFWSYMGISRYNMLPYFYSNGMFISADYSVGKITLWFKSINGTNVTPTPNMNKFRYMIIPGNSHLRLKKPLNQMAYDEVCELYNIPK